VLALTECGEKLHIGLAPFMMGRSDLPFDVILHGVTETVPIGPVQFNLILKIDVAQHMENFPHHGVDAGGVRILAAVNFLILILLQMSHVSSAMDGASPTHPPLRRSNSMAIP
jgi:hypothetical protein